MGWRIQKKGQMKKKKSIKVRNLSENQINLGLKSVLTKGVSSDLQLLPFMYSSTT